MNEVVSCLNSGSKSRKIVRNRSLSSSSDDLIRDGDSGKKSTGGLLRTNAKLHSDIADGWTTPLSHSDMQRAETPI